MRVGFLSNNTEGAVHQMFELLPDDDYSWTITQEEMAEKVEKYSDKAFLADNEQFKGAQNIAVDTYKDKVIIKHIGETFPMFIKYKYKNSDTIECMGADNVYVTLNGVEVFENFYSSGLDEDKIVPLERELINTNEDFAGSLKTNYFVVVELTVENKYVDNAVNTYTHIGTEDLIDKHSTDFSDKIGYDNSYPGIIWYSGEYDSEGQRIMTLEGGEKYTFKVGIKVGEEYIDNNNLYLRICNRNTYIEDYVFQLFDLLNEKAE